MEAIQFEAKLSKIKDSVILHLPQDASALLPSRGMTMVAGTMNGIPFKTLLEPDGVYGLEKLPSHWFRPDEALLKRANIKEGDMVIVALKPTDEWIDPEMPEDIKAAFEKHPKAFDLWKDITPLTRWDWIRWIRAVKTEKTRQQHIEVMISKLNTGIRRPCCFNRNLCSDPEVSRNWVLLES